MGFRAIIAGPLAVVLAVVGHVDGAPKPAIACPPFNKGSFTIQQYQLYPENADWDVNNCIVYFGYVVFEMFQGSKC